MKLFENRQKNRRKGRVQTVSSVDALEARVVMSATALTASSDLSEGRNDNNPPDSETTSELRAGTQLVDSPGWAQGCQAQESRFRTLCGRVNLDDIRPGTRLHFDDGSVFEFRTKTSGVLVNRDGSVQEFDSVALRRGNRFTDVEDADGCTGSIWTTMGVLHEHLVIGRGLDVGPNGSEWFLYDLNQAADYSVRSLNDFGANALPEESESLSDIEQLDDIYSFFSSPDEWQNWGGKDEKWFRGKAGEWFFITPRGNVSRWTTRGAAEGEHIGKVDVSCYEDVENLTTAADSGVSPGAGVSAQLQTGAVFSWTSPSSGYLTTRDGIMEQYRDVTVVNSAAVSPGQLALGTIVNSDLLVIGTRFFDSVTSVSREQGFHGYDERWDNWGGRDEKWFRNREEQWCFITPDGVIYRWSVAERAQGSQVASVGSDFHQNIDQLFGAPDILSQLNASVEDA